MLYNKRLVAPTSLLILVVILQSCASKNSDDLLFSQLDNSLVQSNKRIAFSNDDIIHALQNKATEERMSYRALIWLPKALRADSLSQLLLKKIDSFKTIVRSTSLEGTPNNDANSSSMADILYTQLIQFPASLLMIDERMKDVDTMLVVMNKKVNSRKQFEENFFTAKSTQQIVTFLNSTKGNVLNAEHTCLRFFLDQLTVTDDYISFEAIVGQNAQILKAGNDLEITTGLGTFSKRQLPAIKIGGKPIPLNERGFVHYKFKTSNKPGKYSIPVSISYKDQDDNLQTRTFNVEYKLVAQ